MDWTYKWEIKNLEARLESEFGEIVEQRFRDNLDKRMAWKKQSPSMIQMVSQRARYGVRSDSEFEQPRFGLLAQGERQHRQQTGTLAWHAVLGSRVHSRKYL